MSKMLLQKMLDKLTLCGFAIILYYFSVKSAMVLFPFIIVVLLSVVNLYFQNSQLSLFTFLLFTTLCCFAPLYSIFLPVLLYDIIPTVFRWAGITILLPFLGLWDIYQFSILVLLTIFSFLFSLLLGCKTAYIERLTEDYDHFRKTSHELSLAQEAKSKSLLENQDYQIQTATLNERNRISKEIHDHVGHVLSRSLLQIGALLTISNEPAVKEGLTALKASISEGMDSIRASIHNIHDESIDLKSILEKLIHDFTFCKITFIYSLKLPPSLKLKYCFIAVAKEGLSNIIKHSNADNVTLSLTEESNTYYFLLEDNGIVEPAKQLEIKRALSRTEFTEGLGLQSLYDRVKSFNGTFKITTGHLAQEHGFKIEITIPKEDFHEITTR